MSKKLRPFATKQFSVRPRRVHVRQDRIYVSQSHDHGVPRPHPCVRPGPCAPEQRMYATAVSVCATATSICAMVASIWVQCNPDDVEEWINTKVTFPHVTFNSDIFRYNGSYRRCTKESCLKNTGWYEISWNLVKCSKKYSLKLKNGEFIFLRNLR